MKRFVVLCLAALLLLSAFCGCEMPGEISNETTTNQETVNEETSANKLEENVEVGVDKMYSDFLYTVNEDGGVTIKNYYGNASELVLPEYIDGMPVTEIGDYAFGGTYNATLESVTLNNTLVRIGDDAFGGCVNLKSLTVPESVTSGGYNLYNCDSIEIIYGKKGSFAEICAAKNSIDFVDLEIGYTREYSKEPVDPRTLDYFACKQIGCNTFRDESQVQDAQALFGYDRYGQCYTYVPAWDVYFQVPIPSYEEPRDALISEDNLLIISSTPEGICVTTYKFANDGSLIESYGNEFSSLYQARDFDEAWLYNWYQDDLIYAFFLENTMATSEDTDYVMHKFQSIDCGKSWTLVEADRLELTYANLNMFKMFTNDHGVIVNEYAGEYDIFVTNDGGGTWILIEEEGIIACNGVYRNSTVKYAINRDNELSINIEDWNEDHRIVSLSDEDVEAFVNTVKAIVINRERAFLLLKRYDAAANKVTVVSFEKGSQSETVVKLDVDEAVYKLGGNFINETTGYLFAFWEGVGNHAKGDSKLSSLFKTEDGGNTWMPINVQSVPSISLSENVIFAKMVNEQVGVIAGRYYADDYSFCERTLLTTDGGSNWVSIAALPQINVLCGAEVTDFTQLEESYILTIRYKTSETDYDYAKYESSDLNTWVRIS